MTRFEFAALVVAVIMLVALSGALDQIECHERPQTEEQTNDQ